MRSDPSRRRWILAGVVLVVSTLGAAGCATIQEVIALRQVGFRLDRTSDVRVAEVSVDRLQRYEDLRPTDIARLTAALANGTLPLELTLHVAAENPDSNGDARLLALDWTLFLRERETVSGTLDREYAIPAGRSTDIPIRIGLDLRRFFDDSLPDLVAIALDAAGRGGLPRGVELHAHPVVETPFGPIRYPNPIVIDTEPLAQH